MVLAASLTRRTGFISLRGHRSGTLIPAERKEGIRLEGTEGRRDGGRTGEWVGGGREGGRVGEREGMRVLESSSWKVRNVNM